MVLWLAKNKTSKRKACQIGLCLFVSSFKNSKAAAIIRGVLTPKYMNISSWRRSRVIKDIPYREHGSGAEQPHAVGWALAPVPRMSQLPVLVSTTASEAPPWTDNCSKADPRQVLVLAMVLGVWISLFLCDVKPLHSPGRKLSFPHAVKKIFREPHGGDLSLSVHRPGARWLVAFLSSPTAGNRWLGVGCEFDLRH